MGRHGCRLAHAASAALARPLNSHALALPMQAQVTTLGLGSATGPLLRHFDLEGKDDADLYGMAWTEGLRWVQGVNDPTIRCWNAAVVALSLWSASTTAVQATVAWGACHACACTQAHAMPALAHKHGA